MNALAAQLQTYFTVFARAQRDLSENTIASYRDTWRMLLTFLATRTGARLNDSTWPTSPPRPSPRSSTTSNTTEATRPRHATPASARSAPCSPTP